MADFWRDLIWTAVRDTTNTLSVVMPGVLAMLALVVLGAVLGWIGGALVRRLANAGDLDRRSREWGLTHALARAGVYRTPSELLRLGVFLGGFVVFPAVGGDAPPVPRALGPRDHQPHLNGRRIAGCSCGTSPVERRSRVGDTIGAVEAIAERHTVGGGAPC